MRAIGEHIDQTFQLGALDTGIPGFYEPFGWFVWKGPTFVRMDPGPSPRPTRTEASWFAGRRPLPTRSDRAAQLRLASRRRLVTRNA